jgi:hypothetical protein
MKPYLKLAYTLVLIGMGIFALERFGLAELNSARPGGLRLDPNLLSILVIAPFLLIIAGIVVFMIGKMRRL